jgi:uncharacterized membrane protein YidH (DUF202 family)
MLFLVPLALSLLSTGYGVYQGIKANDALASQGSASVDQALADSRALFLNQDAAYRKARIDLADAEQQYRLEQQQTVHQASWTLYAVGVVVVLVLVGVIVYQARQPKPVRATG